MTDVHIYQGSKLVATIANATFCPRVGESVALTYADYEVLSVTHQHLTNSVTVHIEED